MLSIIKQPNAINFSKNPITLEVQAASIWQIEARGKQANTQLAFANLSDIVVGSYINIKWNTNEIQFDAVDSVDANNTNNEFEAYSNQPLFVQLLADFLSRNWEVRHAMSIQYTPILGNLLTFNMSGEPCDNLTITTNIPNTTIQNQQGVIPMPLADYFIIAKVFVGTSTFESIADIEIQPTDKTPFTASLYIEEFLNDTFSPQPPTVATWTNIPIQQFFIRFTDKRNGKGRHIFETPKYFLLRGGIQWYNCPSDFLTHPFSDIINSLRLLTQQPSVKLSVPTAQEYLHVLAHETINGVFIETEATWQNGTKTTHIQNVPALQSRHLYVLPCGFNALNITNGALKIQSWTVRIKCNFVDFLGQSSIFAFPQKQTYQVPYTCSEQPTIFIFENTLGGFDTLVCTEGVQRGGKIEQELSVTNVNGVWSPNGNVSIFRKETMPMFKIGTGWLDTAHILWIQQEFLESENVWQLMPDGRRLRVIVKTDNIPPIFLREDIHRIEFEYAYAFQE
jgi:hypothetical protein